MFRIFTVARGVVTPGAEASSLKLKGADLEISAILVGEEGRGRERGVLPVDGVKVGDTILTACLGTTRAGKPKLTPSSGVEEEKILVVFRTPIGFRGGNSHTGDRAGWECRSVGCRFQGEELTVPEACTQCGDRYSSFAFTGPQVRFHPFPGEVLVRGRIAQGTAGRMGGGAQLIALLPKGAVFRTGYSGRLYGSPAAHYYKWDGNSLLSGTWEERELADTF